MFGTLTKIADLNTSIPGGTGNFTNFVPVDPCISGGNVGQEVYVHKDAMERIREQSREETTRTKTVDQMWADLLAANADGR